MTRGSQLTAMLYASFSVLVVVTTAVATAFATWRGVRIKNAEESADSWKRLNEACEAREKATLLRLDGLRNDFDALKSQYDHLEKQYLAVQTLNVTHQQTIARFESMVQDLKTRIDQSNHTIEELRERQESMTAFNQLIDEATAERKRRPRVTKAKETNNGDAK